MPDWIKEQKQREEAKRERDNSLKAIHAITTHFTFMLFSYAIKAPM